MEIVSGLFLSQRIIYQNEKTVHLTDLGKAFEWLFNIKLGDYHQKYMDVIKRKPAKLTEFLKDWMQKLLDKLVEVGKDVKSLQTNPEVMPGDKLLDNQDL